MPSPKPRQPRTLLIALNLQLSLARNLRGRDLNRNLPLNLFLSCFCLVRFRFCRVGGFCGAHGLPFTTRCIQGLRRANGTRPNSYVVHLSVKTEGEQRQTGGGRSSPRWDRGAI